MNYNSIMNIGQTLYRVGVWDFDGQFEVEELEIYSVEFYNNETYYKSYPFSDLVDNTICEEKHIATGEKKSFYTLSLFNFKIPLYFNFLFCYNRRVKSTIMCILVEFNF